MSSPVQSLLGLWHRWIGGAATAPTSPLPDTAPAALAEVVPIGLPVVARVMPDPDEIRQALEETVMTGAVTLRVLPPPADVGRRRQETLAALGALKEIPSLQSFARRFILAASRDNLDVNDVVTAIGRDPALCVRVLRMANSTAIGAERHVDDLSSAVQLLGVVRIRTLMQVLYTLNDSRHIAPGFDWRHLWMHGLATAALAEEIEVRLGLNSGPLLYLAALLHDVGKIVLSVIAPENYRDLLLLAWRESEPLEALEQGDFGVTHREAGRMFLGQNDMAEAVLAVAAFHHDPQAAPKEYREMTALVSVANFVSKAYGLGFSGSTLREDEAVLADLPAWAVLAAQTGRRPDLAHLESNLRDFIPGLKAMLRSLREGD